MMSEKSKATAIRLPDKPTSVHLDQLGDAYPMLDDKGREQYDENRFGLIVMDECLTWLNSRSWQDKERAATLNWFLHSRKHGWNLVFLLQSADYCDPQARETLLTYHVSCRKMGKYKVPFVGKLFNLRMPRSTLATITAGYGSNAIVHDREPYIGSDLYTAYRTRQIFQSGIELLQGDMIDMRAPYTMLSAWHLKGRYAQPDQVKAQSLNSKDILNFITWKLIRPLVLGLFYPFYPEQVRRCFR